MKEIICPVCKRALNLYDKAYKCENNHCFDISKYGVVNLSLNNKSSKKRHGDDKLMVLSRKNFLDNGYYEPIRVSLCGLIKKYCASGGVLLDAGCGEGYYTSLAEQISAAQAVYGIDVSKDALRHFKKRLPSASAIVSSIFNMPIKNQSVDILVNMFAPMDCVEFARVLKKDGYLLRTFVLKDHLIELKKAVYDKAYYNNEENVKIDGFKLVESVKTEYTITVSGEDIKNLFCMTPYYYKTSVADQQKLLKFESLDTTVQVMTAIYKKL